MTGGESKSVMLASRLGADASVNLLTQGARRFADRHGLAVADAARLAVLVEELVVNLFEHGGVADGQKVELSLAMAGKAVTILLVDPGRPFDPRDHDSDDAIPDRGGGAGLDLVRAWATILGYERRDGTNRLELLLPIG